MPPPRRTSGAAPHPPPAATVAVEAAGAARVPTPPAGRHHRGHRCPGVGAAGRARRRAEGAAGETTDGGTRGTMQ
jgi:hypothetical protein